jgi:hypothetical protein
MADIEKISLEEIGVEKIELKAAEGLDSIVAIRNESGDLIDTMTGLEYVIENVPISIVNPGNVPIGNDEYLFGTEKTIDVENYVDSFIHIGTTPPTDLTKLWIDTN